MINPTFRQFWSARAISFLGDGAATIALVLYIQQQSTSAVWVGALITASTLPRLVGPLAGTLADRTDQRVLMVRTDLGQAAIFLLVAVLLPPLPIILALVALASLLAAAGRPASSSLIPALVESDALTKANAWIGTALNLQIALGPAVGSTLFAALGVRGALVANAFSFLLSAFLIVRLRHPRPAVTSASAQSSFFDDLREGTTVVFREPFLRMVIVTLFIGVLFASVDNVALVFLVRNNLHASTLAYGAVASAFGIGMLAVSITLIRSRQTEPLAIYIAGLVANGAGMIATGFAAGAPVAALLQATAGAGNAAINVGADTLIQRHTPPKMLGRAFGVVNTIAVVGGGLAALAGGALVASVGPRATFVIGGLGIIVSAAIGASMVIPRRRGGQQAAQASD